MDQRLYCSRHQRLSDRPELSQLKKNPDRQTAAIWSAIVSWLSIRTSRFLTAVENCSTVPFRNVNVCGRVLFSLCRVPSQMICVLSSLSFRRLLAIQLRTRSRQPAKRSIASWHVWMYSTKALLTSLIASYHDSMDGVTAINGRKEPCCVTGMAHCS